MVSTPVAPSCCGVAETALLHAIHLPHSLSNCSAYPMLLCAPGLLLTLCCLPHGCHGAWLGRVVILFAAIDSHKTIQLHA